MKMEKFAYGSVLKVTREDTLKDIEMNFRQMKECGLDTAVIWPSSFFWEEKTEDYPFKTGKEILKLGEEIGIKIIMELAGQLSVFEYIPDYLMKDEYYAVDADGHREWGQASFGFLNYFHPEVNALICEHFKNTAQAYKGYRALLGYDVFNETMFRSFDKYTMAEFRKWLERKYGTIDCLNAVWERTYTSFEQVSYQRHKWMSIMPEADYVAFRKAAITLFLKNWCDAVRSEDEDHVIIADNIHSMVTLRGSYDRPQDDYLLKEAVDEVGMSFYPKGVGSLIEPALRWQIFEGMYSASKREGFLISEMQTHIQALFNPGTAVRPYELKQWCLEGISSGAKGLIYWMWRPFHKGMQTLGRGLVDYKNRPTERFMAAKEIGRLVRDVGQVKPVRGDVAIVYEDICEDFQRLYTKGYAVDQSIYLSSIFGAYKAMFDLNVSCDIIRLKEIGNYKTVFLTNHIVLDREDAQILKDFVHAGGTMVVDGKFGICDRASMVHKSLPGGAFYEELGEDLIDSDYEGLAFEYQGKQINGYYGRELVKVTDGEVLARFQDGWPAVITRSSNGGEVITLNTFLWYGYAKTGDETIMEFARMLLDRLSVKALGTNTGVKIKKCMGQKGSVLFVFNYSETEQMTEYTDDCGKVLITLSPHEVKIIKRGISDEETN